MLLAYGQQAEPVFQNADRLGSLRRLARRLFASSAHIAQRFARGGIDASQSTQ